ncbi:MAG: 6-bladed beta-propeller [Longimicrobiales bacterium]
MPDDSLLELDSIAVRASAAVIGRPLNVIESDSSVYVLDGDYQKIVEFDLHGGFRRVVMGGYGEGPGEFVRPKSMDVGEDGTFVVMDDNANRITLFTPAGDYKSSFLHDVPNDIELVASDGRIFVLRRLPDRAGVAPVVVLDRSGAVIDSMAVGTDQDGELAMFGEPGALGKTRDGAPIFGKPGPAAFWIMGEGAPRGPEFFPEAHGFIREMRGYQVRMSPVGTRGIGQLPDGRIVVFYQEYDPDAEVFDYYIDVLSIGGEYLGSAAIPSDYSLGRMSPSRYGPQLYFTFHNRTTGGVRMTLQEVSGAR